MASTVTTRLVKIGNSQGIRIPKTLLEQAGLRGEVQVEVESGRLILRPAPGRRAGWEEGFRRMAESGDDRLLDGGAWPATAWDEGEWEW